MQSTDTEIWKPVVGYEDAYEVSSVGRVRSLDRIDCHGRRHAGVLLAQLTGDRGHRRVALWRANARKVLQVHRLVLEAFVGPCPEGMEGCHWDGDPTNNRPSNLRWDTRLANAADTRRLAAHGNTKKTHCPRGHALELPNIYPDQPERACVACARERVAAYKQKRPFDAARADARYATLMGHQGCGATIDVPWVEHPGDGDVLDGRWG